MDQVSDLLAKLLAVLTPQQAAALYALCGDQATAVETAVLCEALVVASPDSSDLDGTRRVLVSSLLRSDVRPAFSDKSAGEVRDLLEVAKTCLGHHRSGR